MRRPGAQPEVGADRRIGVGGAETKIDRIVALPGQEPLYHRVALEHHDVDSQAECLELVADHRRAAFERRLSLLRQQVNRAARPCASSSTRSPSRSIRPIDARSACARSGSCGVCGSRSKPGAVGGRDRAVRPVRRAKKDRVGERLPIDRQRNGLAQLVALNQLSRVARQCARLEVDPKAVGVEPGPRSSS